MFANSAGANPGERQLVPEQSHPLVRFLDEQGALTSSEANESCAEYAAEVDEQLLQRCYEEMVLARSFDSSAAALQRQGELALWVPNIGQEGCQVGAALALRDQDWVVPSYRELAIARIRGVPWQDIIALFRGTSHGAWDWRATRFHQYTLVIGAQASHGVGFAWGRALDGASGHGDREHDEAVLTCFGDGATSEGAVSEAMVFAASFSTPNVFLCQNNGWAISVPSSVQASAPLAERARGFGLAAYRVDGNDPIAVYAAVRSLMDRARKGEGPGFVEAVTFRMGAHTSSDDPTKYRDDDLVQRWARRDPILRVRRRLIALGCGQEFFSEVDDRAAEEASQLRSGIRALPDPESMDMFRNVYTEPHPLVEAEAQWMREYLAEEEAHHG